MHHELSIAERVKIFIEQNFKPEEFENIEKIVIGIGKLVVADKNQIEEAFNVIKKESDFPDLEIKFITDELLFECKDCGKKLSSQGYEIHCPYCGGDLRVLSGDEIYIKEVVFK